MIYKQRVIIHVEFFIKYDLKEGFEDELCGLSKAFLYSKALFTSFCTLLSGVSPSSPANYSSNTLENANLRLSEILHSDATFL